MLLLCLENSVKCYYCGCVGDLGNWQPTDESLTENGHLFPGCRHVQASCKTCIATGINAYAMCVALCK